MLNLMKEYGHAEGHLDSAMVEVEELGLVTLTGWNGEFWNCCYRSDLSGYPLDDTARSFCLRPVYQEETEDEYKLVGFEECF